jgi:mono/diheme cytochrome c family protein
MSLLVKSVVATGFIVSGILAAWCMFTLMGKAKRKLSGTALRRLHKIFGFIFLILSLVLTYYCAKFVRAGGDNLPVRAVIHSVIAVGLLIVLLLKLIIVQFYREFIRFVPVMGIMVLVLALVVFATSAGFYFLTRSKPLPVVTDEAAASLSAKAQEGMAIYENQCAFCHHADKLDSKLGPGLKGLLKSETLPSSGRPATLENVRSQLVDPVGGMPSFESTLSEEEMEALLEYLGTL